MRFGRSVCEAFGFVDVRGRFQLAGCLKTLRKLADTGAIVLPAAQRGAPSSIPRRLVGSLPAASEVPGRLEAVGKLGLVVVESRDERQVWNTMIGDEHPRGMTTFAGCQMRYLVASSHGYLGAAGFSASALRLSARDRWMAWSDEQRKQALNRVVCMSRFLIRPGVCLRQSGEPRPGADPAAVADGFRSAIRLPSVACRDVCRTVAKRGQPASGEFPLRRADHGPRAARTGTNARRKR